MSLKVLKDWALPLAIIVGCSGAFPAPPSIFAALSKFELFQWLLVFVVVHGLSTAHDVQTSLIITVSFYIASKLLALRDVVQQTVATQTAQSLQAQAQLQAQLQAQSIQTAQTTPIEPDTAAEAQAAIKAAQAAAQSAAAKTKESFRGRERFNGGCFFC